MYSLRSLNSFCWNIIIEKPSCYLLYNQVSIDEDTGPGVEVTTVTARDADDGENAEVRYSMISTQGFYINTLTGNGTIPFIQYIMWLAQRVGQRVCIFKCTLLFEVLLIL